MISIHEFKSNLVESVEFQVIHQSSITNQKNKLRLDYTVRIANINIHIENIFTE